MTLQEADIETIRREFPEYPVETLPTDIPDWLISTAWHNDACPIWGDAGYADNGTGIALAIEHPDPAMREVEGPRFSVWRAEGHANASATFDSDDWAEARAELGRLHAPLLLAVGMRVRLKRGLAPYPLGLFPAGTTGTVTWGDYDARPTNPIAMVKLDEHFEDLDEWSNELQVFRLEDEASEVTPEAFEPVEGEGL